MSQKRTLKLTHTHTPHTTQDTVTDIHTLYFSLSRTFQDPTRVEARVPRRVLYRQVTNNPLR